MPGVYKVLKIYVPHQNYRRQKRDMKLYTKAPQILAAIVQILVLRANCRLGFANP
jgi:hypothetical protein